jgi:uncharacterized protein YecT (DUF1311 family)
MKMVSRLPAVVCLALIAAGVGCRDSNKKVDVVNVAQDTMLLRDLAEANKNTASAAAMDNSLNTIRTAGGDSLAALVDQAAQPRTVVRQPPTGSEALTSGSRLAPPLKANDAPYPTTVSTELSPAGASSGDPCDSPAAVDQRSCLNRSIVQNDAALNRTYQDLLEQSRKSGGPELEQRFRQSQRDWVLQRDADCRGVGEGTLWARARSRCLANQSEQRAAELRRNLNSLRGQ